MKVSFLLASSLAFASRNSCNIFFVFLNQKGVIPFRKFMDGQEIAPVQIIENSNPSQN